MIQKIILTNDPKQPTVEDRRLSQFDRNAGLGGGLAVRSGLHAGQWRCRSCVGEVRGSRMLSPDCSFCEWV